MNVFKNLELNELFSAIYASGTNLLFSKNVFHDDITIIKGNNWKINNWFPLKHEN